MDQLPLSHDEVSAYLAVIERHMRTIVEGGTSPYEAGCEIWRISMGAAERSPDVAWPLWLIWGALTDKVETDHSREVDAIAMMRRAAAEWLALPPANDSPRTQYFQRWVYEEIGYDGPMPTAV